MTTLAGQKRLRSATFAMAVLLSLTMVFIAGRQIIISARFADLLKLSADLDRQDSISAQTLARNMPDTAIIVADGICREDIIQAGKKLVMRDLDRRSPGEDALAWQKALADAEGYIRHSLSCLPANGDLWLRLAMLRQANAATPDEIAHLMQQSQMLNPAEASIIAARMTMWNRLPPQTMAIASDAYQSDLAIICSDKGVQLRKQFPDACKEKAGS